MSQALLQKAGDQFVTALPLELIEHLRLQAGQAFEISVENGRIVLTPVTSPAPSALQLHEQILHQYYDAFHRLANV